MSSIGQTRENNKQWLGYLAPVARDCASVAAVGILLLCVHYGADPFIRGFHCDDETIRYPYKESTISSGLCYSVGSALNIILVLVLEYQNLLNEANNSRSRSEGGSNSVQFKVYIRNVYCRLVIWFFGAITSELLTDISKVTAGRLRPHFIDVCRPSMRNGQDLAEYCQQNSQKYNQYLIDYTCSGSPSKQRDARLSFMSGHSSYSSYSAIFAVFYLHSALDVTKLGLIKPTLQVVIISAAFYTGLTRISDYKHHWQDVLAGLLQGTLVATIASVYLWPAFNKTYSKYFKNTNTQTGGDLSGEELNRVSY